MQRICFLEWSLCFFTGAFDRCPRQAAGYWGDIDPWIFKHMDYLWLSRHDADNHIVQQWLDHVLSQKHLVFLILRSFGLYVCRILGAEDTLLTRAYRLEVDKASDVVRAEWYKAAAASAQHSYRRLYALVTGAPPMDNLLRESIQCVHQLASPRSAWLALADVALPAARSALRVDVLPPGGQVYRAHAPKQSELLDMSVAPLDDDPVANFIRQVIQTPLSPPVGLEWMHCVPERLRLCAWNAYRKMAFLFNALCPSEFPIESFYSLARLVMGHYSADPWMRQPESEWRNWLHLHTRPDVGQFIANVALGMAQFWEFPLGPDTTLRQVEAAITRFTPRDKRALVLSIDARDSPWRRSDLVQHFQLPPADMYVFCPRCGESRSMLNQFVTQSGSTALRCQRAEVVTGWTNVVVDTVVNACFCRRDKGKKAALCSKASAPVRLSGFLSN
jgi:hypothetical protein